MRLSAFCMIAFWLATILSAQTPTAVITGVITDSDGAPVPDAVVQITNLNTQSVYKAKATENGRYTLSSLPVGRYDVVVPSIGFTFSRLERKGISVEPGQSLHLDLRLNWGGNLGTP